MLDKVVYERSRGKPTRPTALPVGWRGSSHGRKRAGVYTRPYQSYHDYRRERGDRLGVGCADRHRDAKTQPVIKVVPTHLGGAPRRDPPCRRGKDCAELHKGAKA